jgi:hypothetical protein
VEQLIISTSIHLLNASTTIRNLSDLAQIYCNFIGW